MVPKPCRNKLLQLRNHFAVPIHASRVSSPSWEVVWNDYQSGDFVSLKTMKITADIQSWSNANYSDGTIIA